MVRKILAVIAGYATLFVFVAATFMAALAALGVDTVFRPGTYQASTTWVVVSFVLGFAGAVLGGFVCALIARNRATATVFAGIVFVLGLAMAVPALLTDAPVEARAAGESLRDAASKARQPAWVALLNPFVGAAGILLGSRLRRDGATGP